MNSEQETINLRREENELNLSDLFHIVLANWYWFVLSVLVCAGVAVLYLKWAPKVYTRTASVLIKDNSKGGGLSESAAFEELNMFNVKSNVDNEVLVFKSKRLMSVESGYQLYDKGRVADGRVVYAIADSRTVPGSGGFAVFFLGSDTFVGRRDFVVRFLDE